MARRQLRGVVALDGPSGTGKSTVARRLASAVGARYLDTGAMYRSVTLAVLRSDIDPADPAAATAVADVARTVAEPGALAMGTDPSGPTVVLAGVDVAADIREPEVTAAVSAVASVPAVRTALIAAQQRIIAHAVNGGLGMVVEGRDIGTVVAPDAELKVYLTASADARARRRSRQDVAAGRASTVDGTRSDVDRRDRLDNRTTPLRPAADAIELDTTELDAHGVVRRLLSMVDSRGMLVAEAVAGER
ncbi:MAG TPA: (d)CMP kinase [Pseudonocardiaceae bacterium]|nr:(d)CMP kinase [Pseudonocardiaceae bacterium]